MSSCDPRRAHSSTFILFVFALQFAAHPALGLTLNQTGRWGDRTPTLTFDGSREYAVHMMLLRGSGGYDANVLWWHSATPKAGLWGWKADDSWTCQGQHPLSVLRPRNVPAAPFNMF